MLPLNARNPTPPPSGGQSGSLPQALALGDSQYAPHHGVRQPSARRSLRSSRVRSAERAAPRPVLTASGRVRSRCRRRAYRPGLVHGGRGHPVGRLARLSWTADCGPRVASRACWLVVSNGIVPAHVRWPLQEMSPAIGLCYPVSRQIRGTARMDVQSTEWWRAVADGLQALGTRGFSGTLSAPDTYEGRCAG